MRRAVALLAVGLCAAGSQSPQALLDAHTATGSEAALVAARSLIEKLPRSHEAAVLGARLLLAEGKAEGALEEASRLNRTMPDDLDTYALIVDASLKLGRLDEAERAGQWMLDLRPEDVRSLMRGAAVREALKDHEGAVQMLVDAFVRTSRADVALRAEIGTSLARTNMAAGRRPTALKVLNQVETLIPGYEPARSLRQQMENTR